MGKHPKGTYRFAILDEMNPWAKAIEVEARDEVEAKRLASSYLFARRTTGEMIDGLVHLEPM